MPPWYAAFARRLTAIAAHGATFAVASAFVVLWAVSGPYFGFGESWHVVINAGTSIITFLMVFLLQNARKRDTEAIQLKLDEIIRATAGAHNGVLDLEHASEEELAAHRKHYARLAEIARTSRPAGAR